MADDTVSATTVINAPAQATFAVGKILTSLICDDGHRQVVTQLVRAPRPRR
jgi:hypothetical protein